MTRTNVLTIGGGHGQSVALKALMMLIMENEMDLGITGVVPHTDSGGSTGKIIEGSDMLPMGDWLKCLLAVSDPSEDVRSQVIKKVARHRLNQEQCPAQSGHVVGNFMLAALLSIHKGDVVEALHDASILFGTWERFPIWPASRKPAVLRAVDIEGRIIQGEHIIDTPERIPRQLASLELVDSLPALPEVVAAIEAANVIIFGPGDLFTSVLPGVIVEGVSEALCRNKAAKRVFVMNVMTKSTETWQYPATRILEILEQYTGVSMTHVIVNTGSPDSGLMEGYRGEGKELVMDDLPQDQWTDGSARLDHRVILRADLIGGADLAHHNPRSLGAILQQILDL